MEKYLKVFKKAYENISIVEIDKKNVASILTQIFTEYYKLDTFISYPIFTKIINEIDSSYKNIRQNKVDLYNALVWLEFVKITFKTNLYDTLIIKINNRISIMQPGYNRAKNDIDKFLGSL